MLDKWNSVIYDILCLNFRNDHLCKTNSKVICRKEISYNKNLLRHIFPWFFTLAFHISDPSQMSSWNLSITQIINSILCFCGLFGEAPIFPSIFFLILKKWLHFQMKDFYVDHNVEFSLKKNIMPTLYWSTFISSVH